jgi:predicted GNAT family N-acyltransferase
MASEEVDLVCEVFVEEAVGAYTDADEEQSVEKLIDRDEKQQAIAALAAGAG